MTERFVVLDSLPGAFSVDVFDVEGRRIVKRFPLRPRADYARALAQQACDSLNRAAAPAQDDKVPLRCTKCGALVGAGTKS